MRLASLRLPLASGLSLCLAFGLAVPARALIVYQGKIVDAWPDAPSPRPPPERPSITTRIPPARSGASPS
jgi:hypothetical protein